MLLSRITTSPLTLCLVATSRCCRSTLAYFHSSKYLLSDKRNPPPVSESIPSAPSSPSSTSTKQATSTSSPSTASKPTKPHPNKPKNKSDKAPKELKPIELDEKDLEEKFILGNGPGGQHVNKTSNTVYLKHIPSGLSVKCNQTRSRPQNRKLARAILKDKLDLMLNGKNSKIEQKREKIRKRKANRKRKFGGSNSSDDSTTDKGDKEDL